MIKGINLIPADIQRLWRLKRVRRVFAVAAVVYLAVLGAMYAEVKLKHSVALEELASINERKALMAGASSEYTAMKARLAELKRSEATIARRLALSSGLASDRVEWSRVLRRLSNDIPKGVWLRSLATSDTEAGPDGTPATREKRVRMLGSALANGAVASFIRTLEGSGYLDDVTLSYTQKRDFDTMTVFDFEVTARLKKPAEADYGG